MKQFFKNIFQNNASGKPSKKTGYLIIIGLLGLFILIVGNIFSTTEDEKTPDSELTEPPTESSSDSNAPDPSKTKADTSGIKEMETNYEQELTTLLEKIDGVADVEVMVNLESTNVKVYEKDLVTGQQTNQEEDTNGGTRVVEDQNRESTTVLVRKGDKEVPLLVQTKKPDVRGVLVVANGVDHATVEQWVVESVSRVLDTPTHRVSVLPKQ